MVVLVSRVDSVGLEAIEQATRDWQPASAISLEELLSVMMDQYEGENRAVAAPLLRVWYSSSLCSKGSF